MLEPGGERLDVERIFAVPRIVGPAIEGVPADDEGFVLAGDDARVQGATRTWAAGDGVLSPIKFGGLATHQARQAAAAIARLAGATDVPDPGEPVLQGGCSSVIARAGSRARRCRGRAAVVAGGQDRGRVPAPLAAEHGVAPQGAQAPPDEGVTIERPLRHLRGAEARYLYDLGRQFASNDPEIAALGRRMSEMGTR